MDLENSFFKSPNSLDSQGIIIYIVLWRQRRDIFQRMTCGGKEKGYRLPQNSPSLALNIFSLCTNL